MNKLNPTYIEYHDMRSTGGRSSDLITRLTLFVTLLFIFLLPWGDGIWDGLPRIAGTMALGLSLVSFLIRGTHRNYTFFHFFAVLYIAWQFLSLIWTPDREWGQGVAFTSIQLVLLAFLFTLVIDAKNKILLAYQAYVFGNIAGSIVIVYNYLNGIQSFYYGRYGIANIETDTLSIFLALAIPMAVYLSTKYQNKLLKLIYLGSIPLIFYAIYLTGTRTGAIVGLFGVFYWLFTQRKASVAVKATVFFIIMASVAGAYTFATKASDSRVLSTGKSLSSGTLNGRTVIWAGAINQWRKQPIIGTGLGGLGFALSHEHVNYRGAHNTFIHLLTENGLVGLFLYLAMIIFIFYSLIHTPTDEKVFLLTVLMVLVVSQMTTHTHLEKIMWFILSILAIHSKHFSSINKNH